MRLPPCHLLQRSLHVNRGLLLTEADLSVECWRSFAVVNFQLLESYVRIEALSWLQKPAVIPSSVTLRKSSFHFLKKKNKLESFQGP